MALPQINAYVTAVRGGEEGDGYRDDPTPGAAKFAGVAGAYLLYKRRRIQTGEGSDVLVERFLIVDTRQPAIEWADNDRVTFRRRHGGDEETATVQRVERAELEEVAYSGVETTRLELEPA